MANSEAVESIIVVGRKLSANGGGGGGTSARWRFSGTYENNTQNTSRPIQDTPDLNKTLKDLGQEDKIQVKFEFDGKVLVLVFEGMNGIDVQRSLSNILSVVAGALDGSLQQSINAITNVNQRTELLNYLDEFTGDLTGAVDQGDR